MFLNLFSVSSADMSNFWPIFSHEFTFLNLSLFFQKLVIQAGIFLYLFDETFHRISSSITLRLPFLYQRIYRCKVNVALWDMSLIAAIVAIAESLYKWFPLNRCNR